MQCGFFAFDLLPKKFTINELQLLYEQVLQRSIDKGSFRNKVLSSNFLEPLDEFQKTAAQRRARLYRFNSKRYRSLKNERFRWQFF
jgi:8-oxo-dGTP diphosphatase